MGMCKFCKQETASDEYICSSCKRLPALLHPAGVYLEYSDFVKSRKLHTDADFYYKRYFGVELEVEANAGDIGTSYLWAGIISRIGDSKYLLYPKSEGTIRCGIELVTAPLTHTGRRCHLNWYKVLYELREMGYTSHKGGRCGLHVHVDKARLPQISKIVVVMVYLKEFLEKFSRRSNFEWCSFRGLDPTNASCGSKHSAICKHPQTIEFRFCRGTLNWLAFIASLQCIEALIDFIAIQPKSICKRRVKPLDFIAWFIRFAEQRGYWHFIKYIRSREEMKPYVCYCSRKYKDSVSENRDD
jgi:hypothetical protein